jgi:hypothetical protein
MTRENLFLADLRSRWRHSDKYNNSEMPKQLIDFGFTNVLFLLEVYINICIYIYIYIFFFSCHQSHVVFCFVDVIVGSCSPITFL